MRVALKVSDAVKDQLPNTKQFTEDSIEQEWLKEKIYVDEVIFFQV